MSPLRQARQWWLPCGWLELWTCLHRRADRARLPLARELFWAKCRGDPRHILGQSDVWPIPSVVSTRDRAGKRCCLPLAMIVILQPGFFTLEDMSKFDMSPLRGHAQRVAIALTTSCEQTEQTDVSQLGVKTFHMETIQILEQADGPETVPVFQRLRRLTMWLNPVRHESHKHNLDIGEGPSALCPQTCAMKSAQGHFGRTVFLSVLISLSTVLLSRSVVCWKRSAGASQLASLLIHSDAAQLAVP